MNTGRPTIPNTNRALASLDRHKKRKTLLFLETFIVSTDNRVYSRLYCSLYAGTMTDNSTVWSSDRSGNSICSQCSSVKYSSSSYLRLFARPDLFAKNIQQSDSNDSAWKQSNVVFHKHTYTTSRNERRLAVARLLTATDCTKTEKNDHHQHGHNIVTGNGAANCRGQEQGD